MSETWSRADTSDTTRAETDIDLSLPITSTYLRKMRRGSGSGITSDITQTQSWPQQVSRQAHLRNILFAKLLLYAFFRDTVYITLWRKSILFLIAICKIIQHSTDRA